MRRFLRIVGIAIGALLLVLVVGASVLLLATNYLSYRKHQAVVDGLVEKFAAVNNSSNAVWDVDLQPFGFPRNDFDSPYLNWSAPDTVAISNSMAAVVFRESRYKGKKLVQDGNIVTVSLANGSILFKSKWSGDWDGKRKLAPFWQSLIGVGPYVHCCTPEGEFYIYSDGYLVLKGDAVVGSGQGSPAAVRSDRNSQLNARKNSNGGILGVSHQDGANSSFSTNCPGVTHSSPLSSGNVVIITECGTMSVTSANGLLLLSDSFPGAQVKFGGASRYGNRFIIAVSAWRSGDPSYMTDEWLAVYDIERKGLVFARRTEPLPYLQSQSALNADGTLMLAGSGGHLKMFKL